MGGNESYSNSSLREITEQSSIEKSLSEQIKALYERLQELGYLIKDLYVMDMGELESTLVNRRKGVANECFMVGMLARTALVQDMPDTPEKAFPHMYPPKKKYAMPDFLQDRAIKDLKERGVNIAR